MFHLGDHLPAVQSLAFHGDGTLLASGAKDGTICLWNLAAGGSTRLGSPGSPILALAFHPTLPQLVSASADARLDFWDLDAGALLKSQPTEGPATGVAFLDGGKLLAYSTGNRLDATEPGEVVIGKQRIADVNGVWTLAALPYGKHCAWAGGGKRVTVWDITRPDRITFPPLKTGIQAIALAADASQVAASEDWNVRVWSVADRLERPMLKGHKGRVCTLAFSPDGSRMATGGYDKRLILWDVASSTVKQTFDWDVGIVTAVTFSRDGLIAAVSGTNGRVIVWDVN